MRNVTVLSQGEEDWTWPVDIVLIRHGHKHVDHNDEHLDRRVGRELQSRMGTPRAVIPSGAFAPGPASFYSYTLAGRNAHVPVLSDEFRAKPTPIMCGLPMRKTPQHGARLNRRMMPT